MRHGRRPGLPSVGSHSLWRVYPEYGSGGPNMERTASVSETFPASVFEGWNIGAVSVKRLRLHEDGAMETVSILGPPSEESIGTRIVYG